MKKLIKIIIKALATCFCYIFRIFKIKENKIIIVTYDGKGYGDSAKYITEKLLEQKKEYDIVWSIRGNVDNIPEKIRTTQIYTLKWLYELCTAKVWINNARFRNFVRKRKKQFYIQTWHGSLPIKKIEYDIIDLFDKNYIKTMANDNRMINIMLSNSDFTTNLYRTAFRYNGMIKELGLPRNDILINKKENIKIRVFNYFKLDKNEKLLIYAPTFREDYSLNPYDIEFNEIKNILEKKTKYKWNILIKLHPNIDTIEDKITYEGEYINGINYPDMQELICACDLFITDYSSTMFEALIANKPVVLYTKDLEQYRNERGYYFDIEKLPFKIAKNNNELLEIVSSDEIFLNKHVGYELFKEKIGLRENGKASEQVADLIFNICNKN